MNTVKRRICVLLILMLVLTAGSIQAFAAGPIDPDRSAVLNISYKDETKPVPNARFAVYRVADVDEYAAMTLTGKFEAYKSSVSGLAHLNALTQDQWWKLAYTLWGNVLKDALHPAAEGMTDGSGELSLHGLKAGLYLVTGNRTTTDDFYTYTPVPFMVFLPGEDKQQNDWNYSVTVTPKFEKEYDPEDIENDPYITRKVLKVWDDAGYEFRRPKEVTVQLLCDGTVFDTVALNEGNNWRYAWDNLNAKHEWLLVEEEMPGYAAAVVRSGITFTVTNSIPVTEVDLPVTKKIIGDIPRRASTFCFVLTAKDASFPMPSGSDGRVKEITVTGEGSALFGELSFTESGTYIYSIHEKDTKVTGYAYDPTVYTVAFTVTQSDGELEVERTVTDSKGNTVTKVEFTNKYKKLPQTGSVWWPVPVLLFAGGAFIAAGIVRRRKYEK